MAAKLVAQLAHGSALVAMVAACVLSLAACATAAQRRTSIVHGTIQLPEVSGAVAVGSRLLLAADDLDSSDAAEPFRMIVLLEDASARLSATTPLTPTAQEHVYRPLLERLQPSGTGKPDRELITDVEDITASPAGEIFLITSHSLSKKGNRPSKRQRLIRLRIDAHGAIEQAVMSPFSIIDALPSALAASKEHGPDASSQGEPTPGFNIEGLSWAAADQLLLGLRSPLIDSKAVVLRLEHASAAFDSTAVASPALAIEATLALDGMGIRGMAYDQREKGYWLIAGIAPDRADADPEPTNAWSIWFWNGKERLERRFRRAELPPGVALNTPEAVCLVEGKGLERSLLLVSDDGASAPSHYALIPVPTAR